MTEQEIPTQAQIDAAVAAAQAELEGTPAAGRSLADAEALARQLAAQIAAGKTPPPPEN